MSLSEECKTWIRIFLAVDSCVSSGGFSPSGEAAFLSKILAEHRGLMIPFNSLNEDENPRPATWNDLGWKECLLHISNTADGPLEVEINGYCMGLLFKDIPAYRDFFMSLVY
jgi:hypothetical protein